MQHADGEDQRPPRRPPEAFGVPLYPVDHVHQLDRGRGQKATKQNPSGSQLYTMRDEKITSPA